MVTAVGGVADVHLATLAIDGVGRICLPSAIAIRVRSRNRASTSGDWRVTGAGIHGTGRRARPGTIRVLRHWATVHECVRRADELYADAQKLDHIRRNRQYFAV